MPETGGGSSGGADGTTGAQAGQHKGTIIAAVIGAVGTVIAAVIGLTGGDDSTARAEPTPGTSPETSASGSSVVPVSDPPRSGSGPEDGQKCRPDWAPIPAAGVDIQPCIERRGEDFTVSANVKAGSSAAPGEVTVWVWLMNVDRELTEAKRLDLTRKTAQLHACRISLKGNGKAEKCSARAEPWAEGTYTTATSAATVDSELPHGWNSGSFGGTQAVHMLPGAP